MKILKIALLRILPLVSFGTILSASSAVAAFSSDANKLLARTRAATAKYHRVEVALANGYMPGPCVPGMGHHYVKPALLGNIVTTETEPEALLYGDTKEGGLKLVGVEYFVPAIAAGDPPGVWFGETPPEGGFLYPAPQLFAGQSFFGPMAGHDPGMPWHYDLHVWIWEHNPHGMFSTWNPRVKCN